MKKVLLIDVDEVICFPRFVDAVNEFMGTNYVIDDFTDYYIDEVAIPKDRFDEYQKFMSGINLYENIGLLPDAKETLEVLNEIYDIYLVTSCINPFDKENSGKGMKDKYDFLFKNLPFIDPDKFIFTSSKKLIKGDVQIDDSLSKFNPDIELKILFPSYHNKEITDEELDELGVIRAGSDWHVGWNEIKKILVK